MILDNNQISEVFKGYLECALWTNEESIPTEYSYIDNIDIELRNKVYNSIIKFINDAGSDAINEAVKINGLFKLGMDIWLTRNGHGCGFFDHRYEHEDVLIKLSKDLKESDLYLGDDNKLYFT